MNMNLKTLQKAEKWYNRLKELDQEIIELEKKAILIAEGNVNISLNMEIKDIDKKQEVKEVQGVGYTSIFTAMFGANNATEAKEEYLTENLNKSISPPEAIEIIGLLIFYRNKQRDEVIKGLNQLGFKI